MKDLNIKATHKSTESPFTFLQNEDDKYLISLGNQVVSEKEFDSLEEAENYTTTRSWELIFNSIIYLFNYLSDFKENIE